MNGKKFFAVVCVTGMTVLGWTPCVFSLESVDLWYDVPLCRSSVTTGVNTSTGSLEVNAAACGSSTGTEGATSATTSSDTTTTSSSLSTTSIFVEDTSGKKLATLYEGKTWVGMKQFVWDGKDSKGSFVPGGLYVLKAVENGALFYTESFSLPTKSSQQKKALLKRSQLRTRNP